MDVSGESIRVLYVAGAGRSGSTVLGSILGSHPECVGVGELTNLVSQGLMQELFCACGERVPDCPFWIAVRREWLRRLGGTEDPLRYLTMQARFERLRSIPRLVGSSVESRRFAAFEQWTIQLFAAIRTVAGRPVVIDTSKRPVRALALSKMRGLDLRVLHLVRDPRGVAFSLSQSFPEDPTRGVQRPMFGHPVWRSALMWRLTNTLTDLVGRRLAPERFRRLRYEELTGDPAASLQSVFGLAGLASSGVAERLERGDEIETGHTVAGNRLRMQGRFRLRIDDRWTSAMSRSDQRLVVRLVGPAFVRYGYSR
jgi:hypothetical protein